MIPFALDRRFALHKDLACALFAEPKCGLLVAARLGRTDMHDISHISW